MLDKLAIVIPTKNRPRLLKRALDFYKAVELPCSFYIIDGSDDYDARINKEIIKAISNVHYYYDVESAHEVESMMHMKDDIAEEYVTFSGDDDFLIPSGLAQCLGFLERHPEFDACQGTRLNFVDNGVSLKITEASLGHDWNYNSGAKRFLEYAITGASTNYAIHRRWLWNRMLDHEVIVPRYIGTEFNMCASSVIVGRFKRLGIMHILQQSSGTTWPHWMCSVEGEMLPIMQLIHSHEWIDGVDKLKKLIVTLIQETDGLTEVQAKHIFNMGFTFRLSTMLENHFLMKYADEFVGLFEPFIDQCNELREKGFGFYLSEARLLVEQLGMDLSLFTFTDRNAEYA